MVEYAMSNPMTGKLMWSALDILQMEVGLCIPLLTSNFDKYGGLET